MLHEIKKRLHSRQNSGRLLADKLLSYKHSDAIVLAIPKGGIPVGHEIASALGISLDIIFSRRIKHPAHSERSIGAVSLNEIVLQESTDFIPQSYIVHQINSIQYALREQFQQYYQKRSQPNLADRIVILVDDVLRDVDELSACLQTIKKQHPEKILVAAAVASVKTLQFLLEEGIESHHLYTEFNSQSRPYTYFPEITEEETVRLFRSDERLTVH